MKRGETDGFGGFIKNYEDFLKKMGRGTVPDGLKEFMESKGFVLENRRKEPYLIFAEARLTGKESEIERLQVVISLMDEELTGLDEKLAEANRILQTKEGLLDEYKNRNSRFSEVVEELAMKNTRLAEQIDALSRAKRTAKVNFMRKKLGTMYAAKGKILSMIGGNGKDPLIILRDIKDLLLGIDAKPGKKPAKAAPGGDATEQESSATMQ